MLYGSTVLLSYIIINLFNDVLQGCWGFLSGRCPCMAINGSVQYNGGLPHEKVLYLQPVIPPKRSDIFSPLAGGCSEGLDAFRFFFKNKNNITVHN